MEKPVIFGPGDILSDPDGSASHVPVAQHFDGCSGLGGDLKGAMSHTSGVPFLGRGEPWRSGEKYMGWMMDGYVFGISGLNSHSLRDIEHGHC